MYLYLEKKKIILSYLFQNINIDLKIKIYVYNQILLLNNFFSKTKIRNRCVLTNRARAIYRQFKMSRLFFKAFALRGELIGVKKASW